MDTSTHPPSPLDAIEPAYELAALRMHLKVAMSAADERLHDAEIAELHRFVRTANVSGPERALLSGLLDRLLGAPPSLDAILRSLVERIGDTDLAQLLVGDLVHYARVDDEIDPREEGLLRLVCGALHVEPVSLYGDGERARGDATADELAALVRALLDLDLPVR